MVPWLDHKIVFYCGQKKANLDLEALASLILNVVCFDVLYACVVFVFMVFDCLIHCMLDVFR